MSRAALFFRDLLYAGVVVFVFLVCTGYFVGALVAFLWAVTAGLALKGVLR